ncbi:acyl-CoA dehydrogenase family protein [Patulibacter sp. NPDC049589]|uniref:acyl-CoA dehydrogenase family protein n=1 Tax=Patulibacter sp. NPDC049589 TaxID=3154731 RepID=UPI00341382E6
MSFDGFDLPDDLQLLSDTLRGFVRDEIVAAESDVDPAAREIPEHLLKPLQTKAKAAGLWCMDAPEEFGGGGLGAFAMTVVHEAAAGHRYAFPTPGGGALGYSPPVVLYKGSPAQVEKYVIPTIAEAKSAFTAISEPTGGSDPARAIRTVAERRGDVYVLNGRKMWATNADSATYGVIYARTSASGGRSGISAFVVDKDTPGLEVTPVPVLRNHWTTEVSLENVEIPVENLIGGEGEGFALAQQWLVRGRLMLAAQSVGVAEAAVKIAVEWAKERETFGALLGSRQGVQFPLADSVTEIAAARHLTWQAAWRYDQGFDARRESSMAKLFATEMGFRVVDRCMQILGGMGVAKEMPLEHWFRDLRVTRIVEGASEVQRYLIARDLLGAAATGKPAVARV